MAGRVEKGEEVVRFEVDGGIGVLTLNRPHALNAVHDFLYVLATEKLMVARKDVGVKLVIITGAGKAFCAGADLQAGFDPMKGPLKTGKGSYRDPVGEFMTTVIEFPKPLVAAVNGAAVGIGSTIIPHCDVAFATPNAFFFTPFTQLAVCPEFCSSITFPAILGRSLANEMLLFGRRLSAEEALKAGLISRVLPKENFLDNVKKILQPAVHAYNSGRSFRIFKALQKDEAYISKMREIHVKEMALLDERSIGEDSECSISMREQQKQKQSRL